MRVRITAAQRVAALATILLLVASACAGKNNKTQSIKPAPTVAGEAGELVVPTDAPPTEATEAQVSRGRSRGGSKAVLEAPRTRFEGSLARQRPSWYRPGVAFDPSRWPANPWPGVTRDKMRVLFHMTKQSCGDSYAALVDQVLRFQSAWEKTILPLVTYFNNRSIQLYAGDPADPEHRNALTYFPNGTLFGRTIEPIMEFDDKGPYCEDQARKVGDRAYQGGYGGPVLAAVGAGYGAERYIAENMIGPCVNDPSKRCPMHVGGYWYTDGWYNRMRPYAWSHWASSSRAVQGAASWMAEKQRLTAGKVDFADQNRGQPRKFGIITIDTPENRRMVNEFLDKLEAAGVRQPTGLPVRNGAPPGGDVILTPLALSDRQAVMTQACANFSSGGYTTIFHLGSVLDPIFMFPACSGQRYAPEWPLSSVGYFDVGTAGRAYWDLDPAPEASKQMNHARGASTLQSRESVSTEPERSQHGLAWLTVCPADQRAPHDPNCPKNDDGTWRTEVPDDLALWYYPIAVFHGLLAAAGPDLTPANAEKYVEETCNPCGKNAFITVTFGYNRSDHTSVDDHVSWRFNPNRRDSSADRSDWESGQPPLGGYEVDTSVQGGRRCFDFTRADTCHD